MFIVATSFYLPNAGNIPWYIGTAGIGVILLVTGIILYIKHKNDKHDV